MPRLGSTNWRRYLHSISLTQLKLMRCTMKLFDPHGNKVVICTRCPLLSYTLRDHTKCPELATFSPVRPNNHIVLPLFGVIPAILPRLLLGVGNIFLLRETSRQPIFVFSKLFIQKVNFFSVRLSSVLRVCDVFHARWKALLDAKFRP